MVVILLNAGLALAQGMAVPPASHLVPLLAFPVVVWAVLVAGGGYLAGASYRALEQRLGLASGLLLGVFVTGLVVTLVTRRRRRRRRAR